MSKYRFKTEEEFKRDGEWVTYSNQAYPKWWASDGAMNKYIGQDIPDDMNHCCDGNFGFAKWGWSFEKTNYVLKATNSLPIDCGFDLIHIPEITI